MCGELQRVLRTVYACQSLWRAGLRHLGFVENDHPTHNTGIKDKFAFFWQSFRIIVVLHINDFTWSPDIPSSHTLIPGFCPHLWIVTCPLCSGNCWPQHGVSSLWAPSTKPLSGSPSSHLGSLYELLAGLTDFLALYWFPFTSHSVTLQFLSLPISPSPSLQDSLQGLPVCFPSPLPLPLLLSPSLTHFRP